MLIFFNRKENRAKNTKDNIDEFDNLNKLCLLDSETSIDVSRNFVARLCDQKGKMKSVHDNLNRLRVKIAKQNDVSLAKYKHNPENTKICLYMYTANLSENLKKSE
jgi:hypothetical protein